MSSGPAPLLLPIALAAIAAGCHSPLTPPRQPPPPPVPRAALTLGRSDADGSFVPYDEGQEVTLVEGAQGGFHVWLRYRFDGVAGGTATLERLAHRGIDDALVLRSSADVVMAAESAPLPMFMCPSPVGLSVIDQPIVLELRFTDDEGVLADRDVTLVPRCPDENQDFCMRICTG